MKNPLYKQVEIIKELLAEKSNGFIHKAEIHYTWWSNGFNPDRFSDALLDEYQSKSDPHVCNFRAWIPKSIKEIYTELTA